MHMTCLLIDLEPTTKSPLLFIHVFPVSRKKKHGFKEGEYLHHFNRLLTIKSHFIIEFTGLEDAYVDSFLSRKFFL